ncbi:MAG: hypothetical protein C0481_02760 [Phenylobacterium sp.]|uniref:hypothetical protein n=1 Tax=Phenylobacterium sp. TaxID=1871053 RepID=UPI0025E41CA4|nr:hypothetical protein [Phenylobacterium sp.]MBA4010765.1 hypothetical protein [Phenylobacterium sp.]
MNLFLISYDMRSPGRNYSPVYKLLGQWGAVRLLDSSWLVAIESTSVAVRDSLKALIDSNDGLAVLELKAGSGWAVTGVQAPGLAWLQRHIP